MKNINRKLLTGAAIFGALLFIAAVPTYYGSLNVPTGGTITDSNFTSGNCVQTTTGGLFTAAPCPTTAPGVTAVTGSGNINVTTGPTPNVTIVNNPTFTSTVSAVAFGSTSDNGLFDTAASGSSYAFSLGSLTLTTDNEGTVLTLHNTDGTGLWTGGSDQGDFIIGQASDPATLQLYNTTANSLLCTNASKEVVTSGCPTPAPANTIETGTATVDTDGSAKTTVTFSPAFSATPSFTATIVYAGATPPAAPQHVVIQADNCSTTSCDVWGYGGVASGTATISWQAIK